MGGVYTSKNLSEVIGKILSILIMILLYQYAGLFDKFM